MKDKPVDFCEKYGEFVGKRLQICYASRYDEDGNPTVSPVEWKRIEGLEAEGKILKFSVISVDAFGNETGKGRKTIEIDTSIFFREENSEEFILLSGNIVDYFCLVRDSQQ